MLDVRDSAIAIAYIGAAVLFIFGSSASARRRQHVPETSLRRLECSSRSPLPILDRQILSFWIMQ